LRQRFVEGGGKQEAAGILLPLSLTALVPCLRGLFRLLGRPRQDSAEALLRELQPALGVDATVFQEILSLKRGLISPGPLEMPRLFERYLAGLQTVIEQTDKLKAQGKL
jgi:hypothetical protein